MKPLNKIMDDSQPGGKSRKRKKKPQPPPLIPTEPSNDLDKPELSDQTYYAIDIKNLINEVLQESIDNSNKKRKTHNLTQSLVSTISEFLDCFSLIGYTPTGGPIVLSYSKTPLQEDALKSLLMKFTHYTLNKQEQFGSDNPF